MSIFLKANWEHIIMANYEMAPEILEPFLPKGVELDLFNKKCYISLVGFMFKNTKLFNIPIPFFGNFEEINLRFYVDFIDISSYLVGLKFFIFFGLPLFFVILLAVSTIFLLLNISLFLL